MFDGEYRLPTVKNHRLYDPHVVIIGAGASKAACPKDKNGKSVPLLRNIHEVLGLQEKLKQYGFSKDELADFELLYSNIYGKKPYAHLQESLESDVRKYFQSLCITDGPTLYDYLILSLTEKDAIISFNWDPFLTQAYRRNINVGNLPHLFFPHGNTGVGLCYDCHTKGYANCLCPKCFSPLTDMKLLFPVGKKNYSDGDIIQNEWNGARSFLNHAAGITIFGYSAPTTDFDAYNLLKSAYTESNITKIAPFTIINLKENELEQKKKWADIYDKHMLQYTDDFEETILWTWPRVSLETMFDAILQQKPRDNQKSFREFKTLEELQSFAKSITEFDMA